MAAGITNIAKIPELKRRILFSLLMLAIYRIGVFITTPGVDRVIISELMRAQSGTLLGMFNMFSGGALDQMSVFALGIMPYVSSSIILQLLTVVIPRLEELKKEGQQGQRKITQYTRYGTIVLSIIQGTGIAFFIESLNNQGQMVVPDPGWGFRAMTVISLTAGTAFIMWLGEQITERGIGNGISLIIFAGIVARLPDALFQTWTFQQQGIISAGMIMLILLLVVVVFGVIIFVERGQRKIPVQYAKRVVGRKQYGGQTTHLPLKINTSGVIPPIFASSILMFPATMAQFVQAPWMQNIQDAMSQGGWWFQVLYVGFIIFFAFFYTAVQFNPMDVAENMKKHGGFIPGIRPGKSTAEYIDFVLTRITVGGAVYLAAVCVLPDMLRQYMNVSFYFGGTSLLIVVGVALDTINQIESHLITRHYDGFTGSKGPRIRGRRG